MTQNCPQCGTEVTDELPGGMCPACLLAIAKKSMKSDDQTRNVPDLLEAPTLEKLGTLFPELEITGLIGQGGMGAVYRARQKNLDRIVALKIFLFRPDDVEFAERFSREARALAKLNHPNIVTVHDFGQRENIHFLLMEFVDGLTLRQVSQREPLSPQHALELIPQLCDALQYAHDQGVIHRDIKPDNVLLDKHGSLKIADFGLAKLTGTTQDGNLTHTQQVMGTWNYMAPEQRETPTQVDHRADIYSLGVVIYEMLTGELPVGRFQPPSHKVQVDVRLDEIVLRALEKEPDQRYQHVSELKTGVQSVVSQNMAAHTMPPVQPVKPVKPADHKLAPTTDSKISPIREISMTMYHGFALIVLLSSGMVFLLSSDQANLLSRDTAKLWGILVAMTGGFMFACSGFVRVLLGARPVDDEQQQEDFDNSSKVASLIRIVAMFCAFACGGTFLIRGTMGYDQRQILFLIAMAFGFATPILFVLSGFVEDLLNRLKASRP